jgi:hypothetical protein
MDAVPAEKLEHRFPYDALAGPFAAVQNRGYFGKLVRVLDPERHAVDQIAGVSLVAARYDFE